MGNEGLTLEMEAKDCEVRQEATEDIRIAEDSNDLRWGRM